MGFFDTLTAATSGAADRRRSQQRLSVEARATYDKQKALRQAPPLKDSGGFGVTGGPPNPFGVTGGLGRALPSSFAGINGTAPLGAPSSTPDGMVTLAPPLAAPQPRYVRGASSQPSLPLDAERPLVAQELRQDAAPSFGDRALASLSSVGEAFAKNIQFSVALGRGGKLTAGLGGETLDAGTQGPSTTTVLLVAGGVALVLVILLGRR